YDGIVGVLLFERVEFVLSRAGGDRAVFYPTDLIFLGLDLDPASLAFENGQLLAVGDGRDAIRNGGHAVAQERLLHGDIDVFLFWLGTQAATTYAGEKHENANEG